MKKLIAAFFLLVTFQLHLMAQDNSKQKQAVLAVLKNQQLAWNNANIDEFMSYYWENDSLQFIGKKGITYGWQNTFDNYKKSYPDTTAMGQLAFEIKSIDVFSKNSAFVIGKWFLKREKSKGDLGGYFSLIFKKIKHKWVIVVDHTS